MAQDKASRTDKLKGAHVLVLGGSSGLGFGAALAALDQKAHVTIASSQQTKVDKAVARLQEANGNGASIIKGYACDLSKSSELESNITNLFEAATANGKIDHIILTAGDAVTIKPIAETTVDEMLAAGNVRFLSALIIGKLGPKYLSPGPKSSITFTSGTMSYRPVLHWALQAGWGSGVEGVTRGLAMDLAPIRVNCVSPGAVHTEIFDNAPPEAVGSILQAYRDWSLLGSVGTPDEVAEAYIHFMRSTFITGTTLMIDGGRSVK